VRENFRSGWLRPIGGWLFTSVDGAKAERARARARVGDFYCAQIFAPRALAPFVEFAVFG